MTHEVMLENARVRFIAGAFEAKSIKGGNPRFGCALILTPGSKAHKAAEKGALDCAAAKWGAAKAADIVAALKLKDDKLFLRDGSKSADYAESHHGNWVVAANRAEMKGPPQFFDKDGTDISDQPAIYRKRFYDGCRVHALVDVYPIDEDGKQIPCQLLALKFAGDGEPYPGARKPVTADAFSSIAEETPDDPTA